ncbi:unnamed protein product [Alternaria alternata]|jgi:hypothetical protein
MSTDTTAPKVVPSLIDTPNPASLRYSPLPKDGDSFRLLRVLPSLRFNSSLQCELYTASISAEEDQYFAGSYVWGPPEPTKSILLDGKSFEVRENLFRFLEAFRSRYRSQVIWLDAICINQHDVQERSHQVQEMKRIYSGTKCVYCWLGNINRLPYTSMLDTHRMKDLVHWRDRDARRSLRRSEQSECIVQREYWGRLWIVQEFLLAKDIMILVGRYKLSYREFESIVVSWPFHNTPDSLRVSKTFDLIRLRRENVRRTFESLFADFGMLPCSMPLDGVFALLGLVGDRKKDLQLSSLIDYDLTAWQLLKHILDSKVLWEPFRFAECYNRYLIKGQKDKHMHDRTNLELDCYLDWKYCDSSHSLYKSIDRSSFQPALRAFQGCVSAKLGHMDVSNNHSIVYAHDWRTVSRRSCVLLRLSTNVLELLNEVAFVTYALVEACDLRCKKSCASHPIIGFVGVTSSHEEEHQTMSPMTPIELPLPTDHALGEMFKFRKDAQQRMGELLIAGEKKARAVRCKSTQYKLEINLEVMMQLSTFMVSIEEGDFWSAFQGVPRKSYKDQLPLKMWQNLGRWSLGTSLGTSLGAEIHS